MDFWTSTWSAIVAGVVVLIITSVVTSLTRVRPPHGRPGQGLAASNHGIITGVNGDNNGHINSSIVDNRSYVNNNTTFHQSVIPNSSSESELENTFGKMLLYGVAALIAATVFVVAFPILPLILTVVLGVVIGYSLGAIWRSFRSRGRLDRFAKFLIIKVLIMVAASIAVWVTVRNTIRGTLGISNMAERVSVGATNPDPEAGIPIRLLTDLTSRVSIFASEFGFAGVLFALLLLASLALLTALSLAVFQQTHTWWKLLDSEEGRTVNAKYEKRIMALSIRSNREFIIEVVVFIASGAVAWFLADGIVFDLFAGLPGLDLLAG